MIAVPLKHDSRSSLGVAQNLVAVGSGKGGVGKTWFAITLAHAFARAGLKSLLFDGDVGLANVDIQLGLTPERDLGSVIAGRATLSSTVTRVAETGFEVIAGHSGTGSLAALPQAKLHALGADLVALAPRYDRVILDLGAGVEQTVRTLASPAGLCLVLATDEPTALTDAYAFIKLITRDRPGIDLRIVINQASSVTAGERTYTTLLKACENFLKLAPPLAGIVRRDRHVSESIRQQIPLLTRFPTSDAATDVEAIARRLIPTG